MAAAALGCFCMTAWADQTNSVAVAVLPAPAAGTNAALSDLVVVARLEQAVTDIPSAVGVVTQAEVTRANAIQVADLLKGVPGVSVQGSGYPGAVSKPIMRGQAPGLQSTRVLVLVDGRRVAEPFQSAVEFTLLEADNVDHVEVLRGPASALYGSDALGGVINLVSRRGRETPGTDARVAMGSDNLRQVRIRHGDRQGPVDYYVTASDVATDGYTRNADGSDRDWSAQNVTANIGAQPAEEDADLRVFTGYYGAEGRDDSSDREIDKDYQHAVGTWNWDTRRDATLVVRAYRNGDDQVYNWTFPGRGTYDMQTLGSEVQQSLWLGDRHRVAGGADFRRDDVDVHDVSGPIREHTTVAGLYAQDEWLLLDAVTLTTGLRGDHDADYADELSPHAALLWRVAPDEAELFAGVSRAHRAPALSDRFYRGEFDNRFFEGNPNLNPETLMAYEMGGRARLPGGLRLELTGFYDDLKDSFEFAADTDGVYRNRNVAGSRTYGFESGLRYQVTSHLESFATYTYTDGEYTDFPTDPDVEGNQLQYLAPHVVEAGLTAQAGRWGEHGMSGRYMDQRFADDRNAPGNALDSFIVVDWRSRLPVGRRATLTLNVDNVLNQSYEEYFHIQQPGLTVIGGLEVSL